MKPYSVLLRLRGINTNDDIYALSFDEVYSIDIFDLPSAANRPSFANLFYVVPLATLD
jgi:hypothetical protein